MSHTKLLISTITAILLLLSLPPGQGHTEDAYDIHGDLIAWTSLPAQGKVDQIFLNPDGLIATISINDTKYSFADDAIFRDANGGLTPQTTFKEGMYVEFYYLENTTTITKIWVSTAELAEEHSRDSLSDQTASETGSSQTDTPAEQQASPPAHQGEVILKDGVYQN